MDAVGRPHNDSSENLPNSRDAPSATAVTEEPGLPPTELPAPPAAVEAFPREMSAGPSPNDEIKKHADARGSEVDAPEPELPVVSSDTTNPPVLETIPAVTGPSEEKPSALDDFGTGGLDVGGTLSDGNPENVVQKRVEPESDSSREESGSPDPATLPASEHSNPPPSVAVALDVSLQTIGKTNEVPRTKPAAHRDRRGKRRKVATVAETAAPPVQPALSDAARLPADVRLRLAIHPIQHTASLSLLLSRPEGFPERITLLLEGKTEVGAYDESRYDDVDVNWTSDLLSGELRLGSVEGFQWLRSARRIHIFSGDPNEAELISVSAARIGADHAIICKTSDAPFVQAVTRSAGSPELILHRTNDGEGLRRAGASSPATFLHMPPTALLILICVRWTQALMSTSACLAG